MGTPSYMRSVVDETSLWGAYLYMSKHIILCRNKEYNVISVIFHGEPDTVTRLFFLRNVIPFVRVELAYVESSQ